MKRLQIISDEIQSDEILRVRQCLETSGYALTSDVALGLPANLCHQIQSKYYTDKILGPEVPGLPPHDRLRARDVVDYSRKTRKIILTESDVITMRPVVEATAPREYNRLYSLNDSVLVNWISVFLSMIPPSEQQQQGSVGLNFVRTFNDVVAHKHQDREEFVCIYVAARQTEGALTSLYPVSEPNQKLFETALQPGEYLIFRDKDFLHDATPLRPRWTGDKHYRDTIVALIHYSQVP